MGHIRIMEVKPAEETCSGHGDIGRAQEQPASELKVGSVGVEPADTLSRGARGSWGEAQEARTYSLTSWKGVRVCSVKDLWPYLVAQPRRRHTSYSIIPIVTEG